MYCATSRVPLFLLCAILAAPLSAQAQGVDSCPPGKTTCFGANSVVPSTVPPSAGHPASTSSGHATASPTVPFAEQTAVINAAIQQLDQMQRDEDERRTTAERQLQEDQVREQERSQNARQLSDQMSQQFQDAPPASSGAPAPLGTQSNPWAFQPKDPSADHTGESCEYFTKPAVEDGARMNYYADGSFVAYGTTMYKCVARRWVKQGPTWTFSNANEMQADHLEKGH
jgi:TolA-binding protein